MLPSPSLKEIFSRSARASTFLKSAGSDVDRLSLRRFRDDVPVLEHLAHIDHAHLQRHRRVAVSRIED